MFSTDRGMFSTEGEYSQLKGEYSQLKGFIHDSRGLVLAKNRLNTMSILPPAGPTITGMYVVGHSQILHPLEVYICIRCISWMATMVRFFPPLKKCY
jgi:hypothetical protein